MYYLEDSIDSVEKVVKQRVDDRLCRCNEYIRAYNARGDIKHKHVEGLGGSLSSLD